MNKTVKMAETQLTPKQLDVKLEIRTISEPKPIVKVSLDDGLTYVCSESFPLLPNVPLESYIQYTFGAYNASIHQTEKENS